MPKAFVGYACERSLVCCHHPIRAPVPTEDRPRLLRALAGTEEGRRLADTLADRIAPDWPGGPDPVWRQRDGVCINLDPATPACELHRAGGLDALPASCRNFPRWVAELPDRIEVAFTLTCPTAARLFATATGPWEMITTPADGWPFAPTARVDGDVPLTADRSAPLADALALRASWWSEVERAGEDAGALVEVLGRMAHAPLDPGATGAPPPSTELRGALAQQALAALERLPGRTAYAGIRWETFAELAQPMSTSALRFALDPAPAMVARFVSHGLQWVAVHDPRPVAHVVQRVVMRTVLAARLVDATCTRVAYPVATLFRDAFSAASFVAA